MADREQVWVSAVWRDGLIVTVPVPRDLLGLQAELGQEIAALLVDGERAARDANVAQSRGYEGRTAPFTVPPRLLNYSIDGLEAPIVMPPRRARTRSGLRFSDERSRAYRVGHFLGRSVVPALGVVIGWELVRWLVK